MEEKAFVLCVEKGSVGRENNVELRRKLRNNSITTCQIAYTINSYVPMEIYVLIAGELLKTRRALILSDMIYPRLFSVEPYEFTDALKISIRLTHCPLFRFSK